jgi:4,5:9,10-diseco-3-hydroxy-5,9,17-trioxoandrosta-1(10),2-diene-4-oate hydrolase
MEGLNQTTYRVAGGYDIHLVEAGSGPVVVFLHGSGPGASGASNFRDNWRAFVAAGYRVILPDLIGYGASSKPVGIDYTLQLFADTVFDALTQHGVSEASLVGNSLGGGIAMQIALDHPGFVRSFVLMAPGCIEDQPEYFKMPGIARMVSNFGGPDFNLDEQRRLVRNLVHPGFADRITDALVEERFAVARTQPKDVLMRMRTPNLAPRLGELAQPMLVMWGLQDDFCPESGARHFLAAGCNVRTMTFNQVGHWVQVERAAEFNAHAVAFLKGCGA